MSRDERIEKMMRGDKEMRNLGNLLKEEKKIEENLNLELAKSLCSNHEEVVIGGSLALYLYGVRLERFKETHSDLDVILPYYILFDGSTVQCSDKSNSDFDEIQIIDGRSVDIKIDPKRRYMKITKDDFTYKVARIEVILEAKCKYSREGNYKHISDINEIFNIKPPVIPPVTSLDDLFNGS